MQNKTFDHIDALNSAAKNEIHRNPDKALKLAADTISKSEKFSYAKGLADGTYVRAWGLIVKNRSEEATISLEKCLELYKSKDDQTGIMSTLNAFGVLYTDISDYNTAMDYYLQSVSLSKKENNKDRLIVAYINIGSLYNEINDSTKALEYFNQAQELMEESSRPEYFCACYINMGDAFEKMGKLDNSLAMYVEALGIAEKNDIKVYKSNCLTALGKICQDKNDFKEAENYHLKSLKIADQLQDNLAKTECLTNLAELYRLKKEYKRAIDAHSQALNLSESIHSKYYSNRNLKGLSESYAGIFKYKKALEFYKKYHDQYSKLQNEKVEEKVKTLQAQHRIESARKENEAQQLRTKELEEAFNRISMLSEIGRNITSSLHIETVMASIYNNIKSFISADLFGIGMYNREEATVDFKFLTEDDERKTGYKLDLSGTQTLAGWVLENKKPIISGNIIREHKKYVPTLVKLTDGRTNSIIFLPLVIRNTAIGILTSQSYRENAYTKEHLEIIQAVGSYSAIALENSRVHTEIYNLNKIIYKEKRELEQAYKKIDAMANHDSLTGLPNKRLFMELLKKDILVCEREKSKLAVIFIDLDNFKPVNDTLGHDAGDSVLNIVASRFQNALRESDTIARLGGDEFTAIIKKVKTKDDVLKAVNKILDKTVNPIKIDKKTFRLGASIGISFYPDDDTTEEGLLKKADEAMYRIKSAGKNGYAFYTS